VISARPHDGVTTLLRTATIGLIDLEPSPQTADEVRATVRPPPPWPHPAVHALLVDKTESPRSRNWIRLQIHAPDVGNSFTVRHELVPPIGKESRYD